MTRRVVVTGMAGLCPIGSDWKSVRDALVAGRSGVVRVPEWEEIAGLKTRLGARVPGFEVPADYPRKKTRSMGRVSLLMVRSAELALADAGLQGSPELASGRVGVSCGSSTGSPPGMDVYARQLFVGRTTSCVSSITAMVLARNSGLPSALTPFSYDVVSGPWPVMQLCRLAHPG